jgi:adenylyltransferase/sulfurtransferase
MHEVSIEEFKTLLKEPSVQLIDIRSDYDFEYFNLGGKNIPLEDILTTFKPEDYTNKTIFICNSGKRSAAIVRALRVKHQLTNIFSLKGGLEKYLEEN